MQAAVLAYLTLSRAFIPVGPKIVLLTYCTGKRLFLAQNAEALKPRFVTSLYTIILRHPDDFGPL